tara:strand:- start:557 stop:2083 length:1527 start_codon:yes stop_codon:yes gene_type:complete
MSTNIVEGLPSRKHAPASAKGGVSQKGAVAEGSAKRIKQAVYDIRYRARREDIDLKAAYSQYMSNSSLSQQERTAVKEKLFGKGGVKEAYTVGTQDWAFDGIVDAMHKVFVEEEEIKDIELAYLRQLEEESETKYKVRVKDKSGKSYVRYATRSKITQLRQNPNIESVEMTEHGEPYEGSRKKKSKKDFDGDGKVESSSKEHAGVVHNAIQRAKGKKADGKDTRKEDYIFNAIFRTAEKQLQEKEKYPTQDDIATDAPSANRAPNKTAPESKPNSTKKNKSPNVTVNPTDNQDPSRTSVTKESKLFEELPVRKYTEAMKKRQDAQKADATKQQAPAAGGQAAEPVDPLQAKIDHMKRRIELKTLQQQEKDFDTDNETVPTPKKKSSTQSEAVINTPECEKKPEKEKDMRGTYAKINLIKNKIRSMGCKNPIVMTDDIEDVKEDKTENWDGGKPGKPNSQYNKDGTKKSPADTKSTPGKNPDGTRYNPRTKDGKTRPGDPIPTGTDVGP